MQPPMLHTAYLVGMTRNAYGDYTPTNSDTPYRCHVRIINERVSSSNDETTQSDAMFWFDASTPAVEGSVWKYGDTHYRVERRTEARKLRDPTIQFLKCEVLKYGAIS